MKKNEHITNRISDLERNERGVSIDRERRKKYFSLHNQKKKRFAFLFSSALYSYLIALLFFGFSVTALLYYNNTGSESGQMNNKSVTKNKKSASYELPLRVITQQYIAKSSGVRNQYQSNTLVFSKEKNQTKNYSDSNKTISYSINDSQIKNIPAQQHLMSKIGDDIDSPSNASNINEQNQDAVSALVQNNPAIHDSAIVTKATELLSIMQLDSVHSAMDSTSLLKESIVIPETASRLSVDVFMGTHKTFTTVKDLSETKKYNYNTLNFSIGVGVNYRIKNKLYFVSQFTFSENDVSYLKEKTENKIVKNSRNAPVIGTNGDTTYYVKANTNDKVQSNTIYHLGLGIEYQLFQRNKLGINGFALITARSTKYEHNALRFYNNDTLSYVPGSSNTSLTDLAPASFSEGNSNTSNKTIGIGLTPGFVVGYKLSSNASIIFKPSYFVELYQTKLTLNESSFTLKQNNLFFQLGLRINL